MVSSDPRSEAQEVVWRWVLSQPEERGVVAASAWKCAKDTGLPVQRCNGLLHSLVKRGDLVLVRKGKSATGGRRGRPRLVQVAA